MCALCISWNLQYVVIIVSMLHNWPEREDEKVREEEGEWSIISTKCLNQIQFIFIQI